jgi:hypothetical protein
LGVNNLISQVNTNHAFLVNFTKQQCNDFPKKRDALAEFESGSSVPESYARYAMTTAPRRQGKDTILSLK